MAVNREIFTILLFFFSIVGFISLFIATGPTISNPNAGSGNLFFNGTNAIVVTPNTPEAVAQAQAQQGASNPVGVNCLNQKASACSGSYQCIGTNSTGFCISTATNGPGAGCISNPDIPQMINAGFQNIFLYLSGQQTIAPSKIQCHGVGTIQGTIGTFGAVISGQNGNPYRSNAWGTIDSVVAGVVAIAGIFTALGLLAGLFGAGQFANIIAASGIGIALIFFMQSILASTIFNGTPVYVSFFVDGITGAMYVWVAIVLLRS